MQLQVDNYLFVRRRRCGRLDDLVHWQIEGAMALEGVVPTRRRWHLCANISSVIGGGWS